MSNFKLTRRHFLGGTAATSLLLGTGLGFRAEAAEPLTIGMIYVGPVGDFGWNQAHAVGAAALEGPARRHRGRRGERAGDRCRRHSRWN